MIKAITCFGVMLFLYAEYLFMVRTNSWVWLVVFFFVNCLITVLVDRMPK